ncbi:chemotaxis protein CheA [Paraglaciecola sp. MB-3u-78]|uniref:chemotaxis protein CheA n=1 Tax=Paraglaciecola sp. MB-3u-78 TaxID=2058332 RepID=UPI000C340391|nr:chemotaxis protein CheA [Paraglaciecola sp. MB-3u-78]PKG93172.1 chemotaxis protein CheA [Paraglaciecola sp. MB-3u-78]
MSIDMEQFHGVFFDESQEHLDSMEQQLMELDLNHPDPEQLNSIFRAAHSIKGGSGIFGFDALTGLTHIMENLLDKARQGTTQLNEAMVNVLLETVDLLKKTLDTYKNKEEVDQQSIDAGIQTLELVLADESGLDASAETTDHDSDDIEGFGLFESDPPVDTADSSPESITDNVSGEVDDFGLVEQPKAAADEDGFGFFETMPMKPQDNNKAYGFHDKNVGNPNAKDKTSDASARATPSKNNPSQKVSEQPKKVAESASIRVDTGKIDSLVNLVGELVITQSMLAMIGSEVTGEIEDKLQTALAELQRNTREIQESVMSMRMLPISVTFNRFPRVVRDLSSKLGKKVDLQIEGGTTEIDKGMIEKLVDPLTHLVRNSIDHGIETVEQRLASGKSETGTVILRAEQRGGSIEISITDDGAGLNRERILSKAVENGLEHDSNMPDSQVWDLIFEAGFSTAVEVTDVSGRGVGMDVVRRNIEAIGGRIEIESSFGKGSVFRIHLPLTLAIVDGMCVSVGDQIFVVPLVNIVESIQPSKDQIKVISNDNLLWIREQYWPLIPLHKTMEIENAISEPDKAIVVLIESSKKRFALLVDALVGQQQVVIKSLEKHYKRVTGVAGATIMGDGGVAMILDVESLAGLVKPPSTESKKT